MDSLLFGQLADSQSVILVSCLVVVSLLTDLSNSQLLIQSIYDCLFCLLFPPLFLFCMCVPHLKDVSNVVLNSYILPLS